jgi:membrane associated rhomboid family serine protease
VLFPSSKVTGLLGFIPLRISAWFFLGAWFLYQVVEANFGIFAAGANGGGVAFFAHVGGFIFGVVVTLVLVNTGRVGTDVRAYQPA